MKSIFFSAGIIICLSILSCSNSTQTNSQTADSAGNRQAIDTADTHLAKDFSIFFQTQTEASKLALQKAQSTKVKSFAKQTIDLYQGAGSKLNQISAEYAVNLPAGLSATAKAKLKDLADTKGSYFDNAYLLMMLKQHNIMIREFNAAKNIQCTPLKLFNLSNQSDIIKSAYAIADLKDKI